MKLYLALLLLCAAPAYAEIVDDPSWMYVGDMAKYPILDLMPTQAWVGKRLIDDKQEKLEYMEDDELKEYLKENPVPVILAPNGKYYMIDHHHLAEAARRVGRKKIYIELRHDWSSMKSMDAFWERMKEKNYVFLFDEDGKPIKVKDLAKSVARMRDNPYRSLAYYVRETGGYRKTKEPFPEMRYAILLKQNVKIEKGPYGFQKVIAEGYTLARSPKAKDLPGYIGGGKPWCESYLLRLDE